MKKLSLILFVFLAGCAAEPAKLYAVAVKESSRLGKPSKPLSAYSTYELKPFILMPKLKVKPTKFNKRPYLNKKSKTSCYHCLRIGLLRADPAGPEH